MFSGQPATERQKTNSLQCDPKLRLINWGPLNYFVPQTQSCKTPPTQTQKQVQTTQSVKFNCVPPESDFAFLKLNS